MKKNWLKKKKFPNRNFKWHSREFNARSYHMYTAHFASGTVRQPFGASEKEQLVSFVSTMSSRAVVIAAVIARDIRPRPGFAVTLCKNCIFSWKPDESCHESESTRTSTQLLSFSLLFSFFTSLWSHCHVSLQKVIRFRCYSHERSFWSRDGRVVRKKPLSFFARRQTKSNFNDSQVFTSVSFLFFTLLQLCCDLFPLIYFFFVRFEKKIIYEINQRIITCKYYFILYFSNHFALFI